MAKIPDMMGAAMGEGAGEMGAPPAEEMGEYPAAGAGAIAKVQVPTAALGGAAVGDTVTLTVDSIDGDEATLYLAPMGGETTPPAPEEGGGAIAGAAGLFNE